MKSALDKDWTLGTRFNGMQLVPVKFAERSFTHGAICWDMNIQLHKLFFYTYIYIYILYTYIYIYICIYIYIYVCVCVQCTLIFPEHSSGARFSRDNSTGRGTCIKAIFLYGTSGTTLVLIAHIEIVLLITEYIWVCSFQIFSLSFKVRPRYCGGRVVGSTCIQSERHHSSG